MADSASSPASPSAAPQQRDDDNTDVQNDVAEGKRMSNWTMHQNVRFLYYLKTVGWGKWAEIATKLQQELKMPFVALLVKNQHFLRQKWNTLKDSRSALSKPYKPAPVPSFRGLTNAAKAEAERKHAEEQLQAQKLHEEAQTLLKEIMGTVQQS